MSLHVAPTTGCNLGCTYCYENPEREAQEDWVKQEYDVDKILARLEEWKEKYPNQVPGLHGGEPLLVRDEDLETIFEYIYNNWGEGGHIQTNATMMTDQHIEMFKKYGVQVGISCDGPGELNQHRVAHEGGQDVTDRMGDKTHEAIKRCRDAGVTVGIITVLHEANAGDDEKLERLLDWMDELNQMGVQGHFNPAIPYEDVQTDISLDPSRLKEVYLRTWEWIKEQEYHYWNPFSDYRDNLIGAQVSNCVNGKCDVMNAGAARIIKGNGETTGCGKTWSGVGDGGAFLQGPSSDNEYDEDEERYDILKRTPGPHTEDAPDMGGCKGCKYWNVCTGGCPSAGMNDDHRNRTVWCEAKYALYEKIESDLRTMMPNITLITDFDWDDDLHDRAQHWNLDIKPFAAMRPDQPGRSSMTGSYEHQHGHPRDRVDGLENDKVEKRTERQNIEDFAENHDHEVITVSDDGTNIHADSTHTDSTPIFPEEREDENDDENDGWVQVGGE